MCTHSLKTNSCSVSPWQRYPTSLQWPPEGAQQPLLYRSRLAGRHVGRSGHRAREELLCPQRNSQRVQRGLHLSRQQTFSEHILPAVPPVAWEVRDCPLPWQRKSSHPIHVTVPTSGHEFCRSRTGASKVHPSRRGTLHSQERAMHQKRHLVRLRKCFFSQHIESTRGRAWERPPHGGRNGSGQLSRQLHSKEVQHGLHPERFLE